MAYKIIAYISGAILMLITVVLAILSVMSATGKGSSGLFGYGIYLVDNYDFDMIKAGSAAIGSYISAEQSEPGDIIVYRERQNGEIKFGKVIEISTENGLSIQVNTETGGTEDITQDGFIAKIIYHSEILGIIIGFIRSPFGMVTFIVLPCVGVAVFYLVRRIFERKYFNEEGEFSNNDDLYYTDDDVEYEDDYNDGYDEYDGEYYDDEYDTEYDESDEEYDENENQGAAEYVDSTPEITEENGEKLYNIDDILEELNGLK